MKSTCRNIKQGEEGRDKRIMLPQVNWMEMKNIKSQKEKTEEK